MRVKNKKFEIWWVINELKIHIFFHIYRPSIFMYWADLSRLITVSFPALSLERTRKRERKNSMGNSGKRFSLLDSISNTCINSDKSTCPLWKFNTLFFNPARFILKNKLNDTYINDYLQPLRDKRIFNAQPPVRIINMASVRGGETFKRLIIFFRRRTQTHFFRLFNEFIIRRPLRKCISAKSNR